MEKIFKKLQAIFKVFRPRKMIDVLFASYTVVIIVPILILGVIFTLLSTYQFSDQAKKMDSYMIKEFVNKVGVDIDTVYNITYNLKLDENVKKLGEYSEYSYDMAITAENVRSTVQNSIIRTEIIGEIILYYENAGFSLSSLSGRSDLGSTYARFNMNDEEFTKTISGSDGDILTVDFRGERRVIYVRSVEKSIYAIFVLNSDYIRGVMNDINYEDRSNIFLLDKDYKCLIDDGGSNIALALNAERELLEKARVSKQYVPARIENKKVLLYVTEVPMTTLNTCYVINRSHYYVKFSYIWIIILAVCLFIISIGVFVAKLYSRRIYRPFNNIIGLFKPKKAEYGKKSELEFLESKFEEIANMQTELAEYKGRYSNYYLERFFYSFLNGYITDLDALRQSLDEFDISLDAKYYTVVLIRIDRLGEILKNIQMHHFQKFVKENVISSLNESYPDMYNSFYEFYDHEYIGLIFASNYNLSFEKSLAAVQRIVSEKLEITISVGIAECVDDIEKLPDAYTSLYHHMSEMRLSGYEFIFSGKPPLSDNKNLDTFASYEETISGYIIGRKYDELYRVIDEIFLSRRYSYRQTVQMFNSFIIMLIGIAGGDSEYDDDTMMNVQPYSDIENFYTVDEIIVYLKSLCRKVGNNMEERLQSTNKMNEKIIEYIKNNYMNQIDLQTISEHFGYSKGYFSRYFKKITGKNYIEMLNCYRIDVAKELVKNNHHLKLFEVAEQVGFTSYKTFSEAFKKYDGRSPESYKNTLS